MSKGNALFSLEKKGGKATVSVKGKGKKEEENLPSSNFNIAENFGKGKKGVQGNARKEKAPADFYPRSTERGEKKKKLIIMKEK